MSALSTNENFAKSSSNMPLSESCESNLCPTFTPELLRKAEIELNENPESRTRDIQAFRDVVVGDTDLTCPVDDEFLLRFLRARKFDCNRALTLLQQYYLIRSQHSELFNNFRPSAVKHTLDENLQLMLPDYDQYGRKVFIYRSGKWNPENCTSDDLFRAFVMCLEKATEEQATQINGIVVIIDMTDFGFQHLKHATPEYIKKLMSLLQDCFPARFKGFHFVFESTFFDIIFSIMKPFLNQKLKDRFFSHGYDMDSLHQHICPEILPVEYGGQKPAFDNSDFVKSLMEQDDKFFESSKYGYPSNYKQEVEEIEAIDGIVGNYRKLSID